MDPPTRERMRRLREHYFGLALFERAEELDGWEERLETLKRLLGEILLITEAIGKMGLEATLTLQ
jgi:hypothetical protein